MKWYVSVCLSGQAWYENACAQVQLNCTDACWPTCDNLGTCVFIWCRHRTQLLTCTFLLNHAGKVWAPSVSKHLSVHLECSLYKRHPSASLEWFLLAVHLSSVLPPDFSPCKSLCVCVANFGPPNKTWQTLEVKWHYFFPLKCNQAFDEFLSSMFLPFAAVSLISAGTDNKNNLKQWGDILKLPICLTVVCYWEHTMPDSSWWTEICT